MKSQILAIRAICAVYAKQTLQPLIFIAVGVLFGYILCISFLVVQFSNWWAVFFLPVIPAAFLIAAATAIAVAAIRLFAPDMSLPQKKLARAYVDTFMEVTGHIQTPKFLIIFKIASDIYRKRWQNGYIYQTTAQSVRLKTDFQVLAKSFE